MTDILIQIVAGLISGTLIWKWVLWDAPRLVHFYIIGYLALSTLFLIVGWDGVLMWATIAMVCMFNNNHMVKKQESENAVDH